MVGLGKIKEYTLKYSWITLVITLILIFLLLNPIFFKSKVVHNAPQGYLAGDSYWHLAYITYLNEKGYYTEEPGFTTGYNPSSINTMEPPLFFYAAAAISWAMGIPAYDASVLLLFLAVACAVCALYLLASRLHRLLPYFALPPVILLAVFPFYSGISWGFWKFYLAGTMLFVSIAILLLTEKNFKQSVLLGLMLCSLIITHITMALYLSIVIAFSYIYDLIYDRWPIKKALKELLYPALAGIIGFGLSIDYLIEFYLARIAGNSIISSATNVGYTLYGANPYVSHLGIIFWIALAGITAGALFVGSDDRRKRKIIIVSLMFFLLMLGPLVGYDRIYQFRLLWPLYIALCFGLAFLLPAKFLGEKLSPFLAIAVFIGLSAYLFISNSQMTVEIGDNTYSLVEPPYWEAIAMLSGESGAKVFLIDPTLTQSAVTYNIYQYVRYLDQADYLSNNSVLGSSNYNCVPPNKIRTGFLSFVDNTISGPYCQKDHMELCKFDYFLLHTALSDQAQYNWLVEQLRILQGMNLSVYWQKPEALILKNQAVC